jgi:hypothetical protein
MPCRRCQFSPTQGVARVRCAFETGTFTPEHFACGTLAALREAAQLTGLHHRDDDLASFGLVPFLELEGCSGVVVLVWYKNRPRTDLALVLATADDTADPPHSAPLTLALAEAILARQKE